MLGQYDEAERLYREVIRLKRIVLGESHPSTGQSVWQLGLMYKEQGRYEEAVSNLLAAHNAYIDSFGIDDRRATSILSSLVEIYVAWGKPEKAAEYRAFLNETPPKATPSTP